MTITLQGLISRLARETSARPVTFSALVNCNARKTGNPFGDVFKLSKVRAFTGIDYENSVNRQQVREGQPDPGMFQAAPRSWGQRVAPCLVAHKEDLYLVAKVEHASKPIYLVRRGGMLQVIAHALVAPFLPVKTSQAARQGVNRAVVYRNYALRNLISINFNGEQLRIRNPQHAAISG